MDAKDRDRIDALLAEGVRIGATILTFDDWRKVEVVKLLRQQRDLMRQTRSSNDSGH